MLPKITTKLDLIKDDKVILPRPKQLLGDLVKKRSGTATDGDVPCLREVPEYETFLFYFLKSIITSYAFKNKSKANLLSQYMSECLEAFAVLAYYNGYNCWLEEVQKEGDATHVDPEPGSKGEREYTKGTPGKGKYKGWPKEALQLYNAVVKKIWEQRADKSNDILKQFDQKLQQRFIAADSGENIENEEEDQQSDDTVVALSMFELKRMKHSHNDEPQQNQLNMEQV